MVVKLKGDVSTFNFITFNFQLRVFVAPDF